MFPRSGHCSLQGPRAEMEDRVVTEDRFCVKDRLFSFYAVFDGHGRGRTQFLDTDL